MVYRRVVMVRLILMSMLRYFWVSIGFKFQKVSDAPEGLVSDAPKGLVSDALKGWFQTPQRGWFQEFMEAQ